MIEQIHRARDLAMAEVAREIAFYDDDEKIRTETLEALHKGLHVLQVHLLAPTEEEHIARLLAMFDPPNGATVLDAGCGVGAMALVMKSIRPDLEFVLVNKSAAQLKMCPEQFASLCADFEHIPLDDECFDAMMFCSSIGHGPLSSVLEEAARLLRPGGVLFIYDVTAENGDALLSRLGYQAHSIDRLHDAAQLAGFDVSFEAKIGQASTEQFFKIMPEPLFNQVFANVHCAALRMVKR